MILSLIFAWGGRAVFPHYFIDKLGSRAVFPHYFIDKLGSRLNFTSGTD